MADECKECAVQPLQMPMREEDAQMVGAYSNCLFVQGNGPYEFVLNYGQAMQGCPHVELAAKVVVSPALLKQMVVLLAQVIKDYEAQMGEIRIAPQSPGSVVFEAKN